MIKLPVRCIKCGAIKWWHTMTHCGFCGSKLPALILAALLSACAPVSDYGMQVVSMDYECPPKGDGQTWKLKPYALYKPAKVEWHYLPWANVHRICDPDGKEIYTSNSLGSYSLFGCAHLEARDGIGSVLIIAAKAPFERTSEYNKHHEYCHWQYSH